VGEDNKTIIHHKVAVRFVYVFSRCFHRRSRNISTNSSNNSQQSTNKTRLYLRLLALPLVSVADLFLRAWLQYECHETAYTAQGLGNGNLQS
jgi:hypothetical protein